MPISDPLAHAHRVLDAVRSGVMHATTDVVAHSWTRCVQEHGLDPSEARRPQVLGGMDLPTRQRRMAAVIDCARYEMTTLYQQLGDPQLAVVLTDTEGVILHMVTSRDYERVVQPLGLEVGAIWSEAEVGTNGMGTCVVEAAPVVVQQADHFLSQYTGLTCSAVPILDPAGQMTAVLDVSSSSMQPQNHLLVLLHMTARSIENRLIDLRFRDAHPIHFHSRPEFVYTLHEGKLVVDGDGRILAANHSALVQLGSTHAELRGARLEQIFQTTLDDMLERSQRAALHPIVTFRANAANRFFAVARLPAHEEDPVRGAAPGRVRLPPPAASASPRPRVPEGGALPGVTFGDPRLAAHLATAQRVIAGGSPLLLHAETGAGKEVFARAVHACGSRAHHPFVAINCASLPETLIEAELFGYRAGAFTGAEKGGRRGKIVQSDGGTLFLDEIGDMPIALQARLLRVLDERMVTPLGTDESRPVDFQLISATHRNLAQMVREGTFREDLYYRLAGIELQLPPLRERSDRAEIIRNLLVEEGRPDAALTPAAWDLLLRHPWPGNVRQLHHALRSAVALAAGAPLGVEHFPSLNGPGAPALAASPATATPELPYLPPEHAQERQSLLDVLEAQRWNVSHVAKSLGVSRNTLYRRMHKLRIPVTHNG
ncbi:sigma-54-dependent Fis family transcriptional regulator [Ramlibacter sp. USB13]|uniref:Sigma-54-dependent Fis family transcriptional regulator n=1 Tax=Ramlibacter cellulosilyticus TaxID=2764187 RepID=A0A923MMT8_9BURK|nr:sigma-54-dependent Fis family transcriptional regulator [Ramlibacter cellulosilyticus]MBC5782225.1 sigma-54-dependent Fis family transcriptional regulator [Ramlibacter cellulosilyticus]